jgi:glycosyltransferase involved in cell wall biosynthesis
MLRIITTNFNGKDYIAQCIASIREQSVRDWKCYITDDMSTDGSYELALSLTRDDPRFEVIKNTKKFYTPGNHHQVIMRPEVADSDIILSVDGDDWLPDPYVFRRILRAYSDSNVWLTWGSYIRDTNGQKYEGTSQPVDILRLRDLSYSVSHLKTWKAFLWRQIREKDLRAPSGNFWEVAGDMAYMLPLVEMAGYSHSRYLPQINYVYNASNPLNDFRINVEINARYERLIRSKRPYSLLSDTEVGQIE